MPLAEYQSQPANGPQCTGGGSSLRGSTDAGTGQADSNSMRVLLFSLGTQEAFGIDVSNVREVCRAMSVTRTPNMPDGMDGIVSLRGSLIPVLALDKLLGLKGNVQGEGHILIVAEQNRHILGLLVHRVNRIIHVDCNKVYPVEGMLSGGKNLIAAATKLTDGKLVSLLGVAQVLAGTFGKDLVGSVNPEPDRFSTGKSICERDKDTQPAAG